MCTNIIEDVYNKLQKKELPGELAQQLMAPSVRKTTVQLFTEDSARDSAVLILLYPKNGELYIPFILRATYKGVHSGQVSLPGGQVDESDLNIQMTALRETYEEIGVPEQQIKVLGTLSSIYIPNSNFNVYPHVAYCDKQPEFIPDSFEVAKIIEVPLSKLLAPETLSVFKKEINGQHITAPYFNVDSYEIWGATAMIVSEFKELLSL